MIYAWLRWLNEGRRQTALRFLLWRWRAAHEDRTRLKQRVRHLEYLASWAPEPERDPDPFLEAA